MGDQLRFTKTVELDYGPICKSVLVSLPSNSGNHCMQFEQELMKKSANKMPYR
jgi:hypothetical protein